MSARVGLSLEAVSVAIILIVSITTLTHYGFAPDVKQLKLEGVDFGKS